MSSAWRPIRLHAIVGTRPEAIKLAPLALAASGDSHVELRLIGTGQHGAVVDQALGAFGIALDDRIDLPPHDGSLGGMTAAIRTAVADRLHRDPPDMLLVQGDTTSAYAAALAAQDAGMPLGHVEAGLRSGDLARPWPEERNRIAIDAIADLLFAPTQAAMNHLAREQVPGTAHLTGNSGIDALLAMRARLDAEPPLSQLDALLGGDRRPLLLVTCHRREAIGAPLRAICSALRSIADRGDIRMLLPVHGNHEVAAIVREQLSDHPAITLAPSFDYPTAIDAMRRARLILTDSGGIQEEAPALGVPVLVLREVTERPEALATGNLKLVGHDETLIIAEADRLITGDDAHRAMSRPAFPYGDGTAAARMLDHVARFFAKR